MLLAGVVVVEEAVMEHAFNPSTLEAEAGGSLSSRPAWSRVSPRTARDTQRNAALENLEGKKSTSSSCRDPEFSSQYPQRGSQLSIIPAPRDPIPSLAPQAHKVVYIHIHTKQK